MAGDAGLSQQSEAVQRLFEVLYLDERVRVVRFLPDRDSISQPQLFVFERIPVEAAEEDEVGCRPVHSLDTPTGRERLLNGARDLQVLPCEMYLERT